jgi:hypothetical protein
MEGKRRRVDTEYSYAAQPSTSRTQAKAAASRTQDLSTHRVNSKDTPTVPLVRLVKPILAPIHWIAPLTRPALPPALARNSTPRFPPTLPLPLRPARSPGIPLLPSRRLPRPFSPRHAPPAARREDSRGEEVIETFRGPTLRSLELDSCSSFRGSRSR